MLQALELLQYTYQYGGDWGLAHSQRLIKMVDVLAEGNPYDKDVVFLAAALHDWGAYPKWVIPNVEHYIRSKQIAEEFLAEHHYPEAMITKVLECIENHHGGKPDRSYESRLFTDADALELMGVIGTLRIFSMHGRDLKTARDKIEYWKQISLSALSLDLSKKIAEERIQESEELLKTFEKESFGIY